MFREAERALASDRFVAGVCVRDARGDVLLALDPDGLYPAASVIKIPLVMTLYDDAAAGRIDLGERLPVGERMDGTGVIRDLRDVETLSLRDHAVLTIGLSDNTATNALISRIGTEHVADRLREWGCERTALRRRMFDFEAAKRGLENVATPAEMAGLLLRLVHADGIARAAADAVLALMERCDDDRKLRRYLRPYEKVASKSGTLAESRNDVAVFRGPMRTIVVAAFLREVREPLAAEHALGLLGRDAASVAGLELPSLSFLTGPAGVGRASS
jgi:beta-lactamase class A